MPAKSETDGTVKVIYDTQTFASGFAKREFVIEVPDGKYPQMLKFECVKDKVSMLDNVKVGDNVSVSFDIRGSEYKERFYVNLVAWKVEPGQPNQHSQQGRDRTPADGYRQGSQAARDNGGSGPDDSDDIPFGPAENITHW